MHVRGPKHLVILLALFTLAPGLPLPAQKGTKHAPKRLVRDQIEALEEQWRLAQLSGDVPTMDKLLSEDYLGITGNGEVVTKAQQLERMRNRSLVLTSLDISDIKIKLIGQIAIVNSLAELQGSAEGSPLNGRFRYTRVYQRVPGGAWKITSFEVTRITQRGRHSASDGDVSAPPRP